MSMYALNPGLDRKEAAAIERRRQLEEERKQRIFNPKLRHHGIDVDALAAQVRAKQEAAEAEAAREAAFAAEEERARRALLALEQQQAEERREQARGVESYRRECQRFDTRREFDLNDPEYLRKSSPARTRDFDARLGPASLQAFDGEDLDAKDRKRRQQEQQKQWLIESEALKARKQREDQEAERLYELRQLELNQRGLEMESAARSTRRSVTRASRDYNAQLAAERRERERQQQLQELNENLQEIHNNLNSDLLNENPMVARAVSSTRVIPAEYKGMLPDEIARIREEQARQVEEARARMRRDMDEQRRWEVQDEANRRQALRLEAQKERARKEAERARAQDNSMIARDVRQREEYLNRELYTNQPTQAYWDQWNTTTR